MNKEYDDEIEIDLGALFQCLLKKMVADCNLCADWSGTCSWKYNFTDYTKVSVQCHALYFE